MMRTRADTLRAVALLDLVDLLLSELPGWEIRLDGARVDGAGARKLVREGVERVCSGKIGVA